ASRGVRARRARAADPRHRRAHRRAHQRLGAHLLALHPEPARGDARLGDVARSARRPPSGHDLARRQPPLRRPLDAAGRRHHPGDRLGAAGGAGDPRRRDPRRAGGPARPYDGPRGEGAREERDSMPAVVDVLIVRGRVVGAGRAGLPLARQLLLHSEKWILLVDRRAELPPAKQKVGEATVQMSGYYYGKVLDLEEYLLQAQYLKYNLRFYWNPGVHGEA